MLSGDCNICINRKMPSYSPTCVECGLSRKNFKPITNADRTRAMSDEDLAEWISSLSCCHEKRQDCMKYSDGTGGRNCYQCWLDWLKQEVDT